MIHEFLRQLDKPFTGEELFDHLSDTVFFLKDSRGEYLVVNTTLVARCGKSDKRDLIGRTSRQVLPAPLGDRFFEQDQRVLQTGQPLLSQLELHVRASGTVGWCVTSKLPLWTSDRSVVGLVGVSQDLQLPDYEADEYQHVAEAICYAEQNLSSPPTVEQLATIAEMSRYQLDRRMRRIFGLTTGRWLMKTRVDLAQRLLAKTATSVAGIAMAVGYSDQSAFTRQFRSATGLTPSEYRTTRQRA